MSIQTAQRLVRDAKTELARVQKEMLKDDEKGLSGVIKAVGMLADAVHDLSAQVGRVH